MPWVDDNKIWFNPLFVQSCCTEMVIEKGIEQIKKGRNYKKLVESYDLALTAFAMYQLNKETHELPYIQFPKQDPPDGYIGQESKERVGDFDISTIELTRYDGAKGQSLLEQLVSSDKINDKYAKYSEKYVLLIKIKEGVTPNYVEVSKVLAEKKTPFAVWALQIVQKTPDTIAELTILNPEIITVHVNLGEVAALYKQQKVPSAFTIKRAGSKKSVRKETNNTLDPKYLDKNFGWLK